MHTSTNAKSVPMFVSSTISSMFATAEKNATKTPVRIVVTCGVRYFGWIFANHGGRSPSRDIAMRMRGCPSWKTRSTAVIATTAPKARTPGGPSLVDVRESGRERVGDAAPASRTGPSRSGRAPPRRRGSCRSTSDR